MAAQLAFTGIIADNKTFIVARAVANLPGLVAELEFGSFASWTEADAFARKLNQGLGLSLSDSQSLVVEAQLAARGLRQECECLEQQLARLRQSNKNARFVLALAYLSLGVTYCSRACVADSVECKKRCLQKAKRVLFLATSTMHRGPFTVDEKTVLGTCAKSLEQALNECTFEG